MWKYAGWEVQGHPVPQHWAEDQTLGDTLTGTVLFTGRVPLSWKHSLIELVGIPVHQRFFSTHGFK